MTNYFRITAYHEQADVTLIIDSNGYFTALWELSAFFVSKGFRIIAASKDGKFNDGNIPRAERNADSLIMRACDMGKPETGNGGITVRNRHYKPNN